VGHIIWRGVVELPKRTKSVSDTPFFAFEPIRLREPLAFASPAVGVGTNNPRLAIVSRLGFPAVRYVVPSPRLPLFVDPYRLAVGVGSSDKPNSVSSMWGSDACSWNNKRPCGVADAFQVSEHRVERHTDETSNVFTKNPSGSHE
jgi:hypothetical protein